MNNLEKILDEAILRLRTGESISSIAESYPDYKQDVFDLLSVAKLTAELPKINAPVPRKQYKFIEARTIPYRFASLFQFMRVAVIPASLIAVLFGGKIIVQATDNSLPGDRLYSLKRASEEAQLNLTFSSDKTASFHIELAQRRLDEVKKAIASNNVEQENAAIAELQAQTEKTFAAVPHVAAVNAVSKNDSSLLNNLVAINKEQKSVLQAIEQTDNTKSIAKTALNSTKENDKKIAQLIATVNEQSLVDLPNKISITGIISLFKDNKVTVEKNTFLIDPSTTITGMEGEKLESIPSGGVRITIVGTRSEQGLIAKQIQIVAFEGTDKNIAATAPVPAVKGVVTPKPIEPKPAAAVTAKPAATPTIPQSEPQPEPIPTNEASGSFITEPSEEQYAP